MERVSGREGVEQYGEVDIKSDATRFLMAQKARLFCRLWPMVPSPLRDSCSLAEQETDL